MSKKINVEIKAKCNNTDKIRDILNSQNAEFKGIDKQTDTYFHCKNGRLKLREGDIENSLIFYKRKNIAGPKRSDIEIAPIEPKSHIKEVLIQAYGVFIEVKKKREIYFIENVKFHIDQIDDLGSFVEIEAIDATGQLEEKDLEKQCKHFLTMFDIKPDQLVTDSYSDLLNN